MSDNLENNELDIQYADEELVKAAYYWKDKDPKKYKQMLNKLKSQRKTPGHKERATQEVLQAKRRERGGSGTTTGGHSKGHMKSSTGSAVKRFQNAERKTGSKLSPDRKDNESGYGNGNTRYVPQHLNRGRHHVDPKKLKNWKKKLKKSELSHDDLMTILIAKAEHQGQETLAKCLRLMDPDKLFHELGLSGE